MRTNVTGISSEVDLQYGDYEMRGGETVVVAGGEVDCGIIGSLPDPFLGGRRGLKARK